jgi:two-component system CheB/CheR fusion protein
VSASGRADRSPPARRRKARVDAKSKADRPQQAALVIVGIGGSAGALAPLRELLEVMPADSGAAFVVVIHQTPTGKSLLPEILAKSTRMRVSEIAEPTKVEANHVYVAPRGHYLAIRRGVLAVEQDGEPTRPPLPIDFFFRGLARDQERRAVGIVLSGTGADGTLGLAAIRSASGLSLVQDPETAEFDGMPRSAIAALATDFVLPIAEIPSRLLTYARVVATSTRTGRDSEGVSNEMERILGLIRVRGGQDFSAYKRETMLRRVERRMDLHRIERLEDYANHLEQNDDEIDALWRDWLIGVSGFFRDPEAFQGLIHSGLEALLAVREDGSALRVWVPGCATGEEAYSIAILVIEALEQLGKQLDVRVFATDLDPTAIEKARTGSYPEGVAADVGAQRLKRFFTKGEHGYRVRKELRDLVVFAVQNALHDPPFTRVDLISCRNLLIYLIPDAQKNLLSVFHYSLSPGGLLLLGTSESIIGSEELFSALDQRWKLFGRNDAAAPRPPIRWTRRAAPGHAVATGGTVARGSDTLDLTETLRRNLAKRFGPPTVLTDHRGQIQQVHGHVGEYLEIAPGRANLNVVAMAREGLRAPLASALREALKTDTALVERAARIKVNGDWISMHLVVARIDDRRLAHPLFLVSFEPAAPKRGQSEPPSKRSSRGSMSERKLATVLQQTRDDLQSSVDELQSSNEELASANEEVQSVNEELQSLNEELQTSKEETQSLNEELHTVNAELTEKVQALESANDDLLNLINSIDVATIFLDDRLRVKRFTPRARSVARLIEIDVGRPLADLATLLEYPDLLSDAASVLQTLGPLEKQAPATDGSWYAVRMRPYRTASNAVEGLVVTFIDITQTKRAERVQAARVLAESIVDAVREPLLVLDSKLRVVRANRSFYEAFAVEPGETNGQMLHELGSRQWNIPRLRELLERTVRDRLGFDDFRVECEFPKIGRRRMLLHGRPVATKDDETSDLIVLGIEDEGKMSLGAPRTTQVSNA